MDKRIFRLHQALLRNVAELVVSFPFACENVHLKQVNRDIFDVKRHFDAKIPNKLFNVLEHKRPNLPDKANQKRLLVSNS